MKSILALLRIPLVKFISIGLILYLALFSDKNNPDSLRQRLSKERVNENIKEVKEKGRFIASNVENARELEKTKAQQPNLDDKISITDIEIGQSDPAVACGSEVEIAYAIFDDKGSQLKNVSSEKLIIGGNLNKIIEQNIMEMRIGGIRNIKVPRDFKTNDLNIIQLLKFYDSALRYQVSILSIKPRTDNNIICQ